MEDKVVFSEDFLNRPPSWMVRRGNLIFFFFFILLLLLAYFIRYNEVVEADILVTSENPPVALYSKRQGQLVYMNFGAGQQVDKGG